MTLSRSKPLKRTMLAAVSSRPIKCRACGEKFVRQRPGQVACSTPCAIQVVNAKAMARRVMPYMKSAAGRSSKAMREYRENDRAWWRKALQRDFNRYVKLRDAGKPCVSCGCDMSRMAARSVHASHYVPSDGGRSVVAFHPWNASAACYSCNAAKSGNLTPYRVELIRRIGEPAVEWLESQRQTHRWDVSDMQWMREGYRAAIRRMGGR